MKKKIISLILVIIFALSIPVSVFAADDIRPNSIEKSVEYQQILPEPQNSMMSGTELKNLF